MKPGGPGGRGKNCEGGCDGVLELGVEMTGELVEEEGPLGAASLAPSISCSNLESKRG